MSMQNTNYPSKLLRAARLGVCQISVKEGTGAVVWTEEFAQYLGLSLSSMPLSVFLEEYCHKQDSSFLADSIFKFADASRSDFNVAFRLRNPRDNSWHALKVLSALRSPGAERVLIECLLQDTEVTAMDLAAPDIAADVTVVDLDSRPLPASPIDTVGRVRLMLDYMPLCCNIWDENYNILDCNQAAAKLFELSGKEEYLNRFYELSPKYQANGRLSSEVAREYMIRAFKVGQSKFEWLHQKLNGEPVPSEITLIRVNYEGRPLLVGYIRDLRELKEKERTFDRERRLLKTIMDSCPVCFVIWVKGAVRYVTPFTHEFLNMNLGDDAAEFFADKYEDFFSDALKNGFVNWRPLAMRGADGSHREMLANAFLADYYGEECIMTWFMDVTDMQNRERDLRASRDAAEAGSRAKGYFLANMSHEIRTPMSAILGMAQLVLDTDLTPMQRDYLQKAEDSARALLRILNDILDFSKIEAGKLEMENAGFNLDEVLDNLHKVMEGKAAAKGIGLEIVIPPDLPRGLSGDPLRLNQILLNLTDNAIKFTSQGGVRMEVAMLEEGGDTLLLEFSVKDTGIGLTPEQQSRIFSAFTQAESSTTRQHGGTGLGLAISKNLVEMMGGTIWVDSVAGQGTTFSFTGRFGWQNTRLEVKETFPVESEPGGDLLNLLAESRILVAEDNLVNQLVARKMLEKLGCSVDLANNGQEAIYMVRQNNYDLIFMDIQMPIMDGFTATEELRQISETRFTPIIAMTAHAMVGDREKSLAAGMDDHLTKPIDKNELLAILNKWLGHRHSA